MQQIDHGVFDFAIRTQSVLLHNFFGLFVQKTRNMYKLNSEFGFTFFGLLYIVTATQRGKHALQKTG